MKKPRIIALLRDQHSHVIPVKNALSAEVEFVFDEKWDPEKLLQKAPDLVVCVNDFQHRVAECLEACRQGIIPTLVMQDGILEWRCQYENPRFGAGGAAPQHQPVLADKIACIGLQSARQIARWGNLDKVEVTGMSRLDHFQSRRFRERAMPGQRILVMTAKKPGFTQEQVDITMRSLRDLKGTFDRWRGVEVIWRITKSLFKELGVDNQFSTAESVELAEILDRVDAVITTPSTAMVEAMLAGRPVAVLDYHNMPRFVQSAWTISAPEHIGQTVEEILDPSARKMAFQDDCLHDILFTDENAAERVARLMLAMIGQWSAAREAGGPLHLPSNMLGYDPFSAQIAVTRLGDLYPEHESLQEDDITRLQVRLARAQGEISGLEKKLRTRGLGYWLERAAIKAARALRRD